MALRQLRLPSLLLEQAVLEANLNVVSRQDTKDWFEKAMEEAVLRQDQRAEPEGPSSSPAGEVLLVQVSLQVLHQVAPTLTRVHPIRQAAVTQSKHLPRT